MCGVAVMTTLTCAQARIRVESKSVSHKAHALAPNTIVLRASAQAYPRHDIHPQYHVNLPLHSSYDELMDCMRLVGSIFVGYEAVCSRGSLHTLCSFAPILCTQHLLAQGTQRRMFTRLRTACFNPH